MCVMDALADLSTKYERTDSYQRMSVWSAFVMTDKLPDSSTTKSS